MTTPESAVYPPSEDIIKNTHIDAAKYDEMYAQSIQNPEKFWAEQAERITWIKPFTKVKDVSYDFGNVNIKWFEDGQLNVAANCIDRHLATRGDQTAIICETRQGGDVTFGGAVREIDALHIPPLNDDIALFQHDTGSATSILESTKTRRPALSILADVLF